MLDNYFGIDFIGFLTLVTLLISLYQIRNESWVFKLSIRNSIIQNCLNYAVVFGMIALFLKYLLVLYQIDNNLTLNDKLLLQLDFFIFIIFIIGIMVFVFFSTQEKNILQCGTDYKNMGNIIARTIFDYNQKKYHIIYNFLKLNLKDLIYESKDENIEKIFIILIAEEGFIKFLAESNPSIINFILSNYAPIPMRSPYVDRLFSKIISKTILSEESKVFNDNSLNSITLSGLHKEEIISEKLYWDLQYYKNTPKSLCRLKDVILYILSNKKYEETEIINLFSVFYNITNKIIDNFYLFNDEEKEIFIQHDLKLIYLCIEEVIVKYRKTHYIYNEFLDLMINLEELINGISSPQKNDLLSKIYKLRSEFYSVN